MAVFLPNVKDMYPSGIVQDVAAQKGTFVEVKGYGHQMEGKTRPTFFRGVATVSITPPYALETHSELIFTVVIRFNRSLQNYSTPSR